LNPEKSTHLKKLKVEKETTKSSMKICLYTWNKALMMKTP